jgi:glycogen debranching enzyme
MVAADERPEPLSRIDGPAPAEQPFYIAATGSAARARRSLKHNDTFAVFDSHGDMGAAAGGPDGLFDIDTRFLSHLELMINGAPPLLLGSTIKDDNSHLYVDLTNPDTYFEGALVLPKDTVHISRVVYLRDGVLRERIALQNHSRTKVSISLSLAFGADFADIFEVRGTRRARRGHSRIRVEGPNDVVLFYDGLDGKQRHTSLCFETAPDLLLPSIATYTLMLEPLAKRSIFLSVSCRGARKQSTVPFFTGLRDANRERNASTVGIASVETSNSLLNEVLCRSMSDIYMLISNTAQGPYPLCRNTLVFDHLWTRRLDHGNANVVVGSKYRKGCPAALGILSSQRGSPRQRCATGKDTP